MNAARTIALVPLVLCGAWTLFIVIVAPGQADPFTTFAAIVGGVAAVVVLVLTVLIEIRAHRDGALDRDFRRVLDQSGIFTGDEANR